MNEVERIGTLASGGNFDFAEGSPLLRYQVLRARAGNYDSARWLRDNVRAADKDGRPVDPYVRFLVGQMRRGGLRKWCSSKRNKKRGQRGTGLGEHHQLLLAREMWKQCNLARQSPKDAANKVAACAPFRSSLDSAGNAYYRFQRGPKRRVLRAELARDLTDRPEGWLRLAKGEHSLKKALRALVGLSNNSQPRSDGSR